MSTFGIIVIVCVVVCLAIIALCEWELVRIRRARQRRSGYLPTSVVVTDWLRRNGQRPQVYDWEREGDV